MSRRSHCGKCKFSTSMSRFKMWERPSSCERKCACRSNTEGLRENVRELNQRFETCQNTIGVLIHHTKLFVINKLQ